MKLQANKELRDKRIAVCGKCEMSEYSKNIGLTCGKFLKPTYDKQGNKLTCGCILRAKTLLPRERCPQNKW